VTVVRIHGLKKYRPRPTAPEYIYHRKSGTRIISPPGTPEFFAELAAIESRQPVAATAKAGTLGGLISSYRQSRVFLDRSVETRAQYDRMLEKVRPLFDMPLAKIKRAFISKLKDKLVGKHGHRTAAYVLAVLSVAFEHGIEVELATSNPVKGVRRPKKPRGSDAVDSPQSETGGTSSEEDETNRPWTDDEWAHALAYAPLHILVTILLAGLLGMRRKEIVHLHPTAWDRQKGTIKRRSAKGNLWVTIGAPTRLASALETLHGRFAFSVTRLAVNSRGKPWTVEGHKASFFKLIGKWEKSGFVGRGLTFHGLRHTAATRLREAGYDLRTIADFLGQKTEGMAGHYSKRADLTKKLEGIANAINADPRNAE
jgi:integrase